MSCKELNISPRRRSAGPFWPAASLIRCNEGQVCPRLTSRRRPSRNWKKKKVLPPVCDHIGSALSSPILYRACLMAQSQTEQGQEKVLLGCFLRRTHT